MILLSELESCHYLPKLDKNILLAIKCGIVPNVRKYDYIVNSPKTVGESIVAFAHHHLIVPEGPLVGQPMRLDIFQIAFILAIFDAPVHVRKAYLSVARRNGKTFEIAVIMLAFIVGPLALLNANVASAAMSREQAALAYKMMANCLALSPDLQGLYKLTPSSKMIIGLRKNVEYKALSSDAKTGHGQSLRLILLDEAGQIVGADNDFTSMLSSSQGSFDDHLFITISTQAPSDADYLSIQLDAAERDQPKDVVSHVYKADDDCDLLDKKQWAKANPGMGKFRSEADLKAQLEEASRIPSKENGARNLLLNNRIALVSIWLAPRIWKENSGAPDEDLFYSEEGIHIGLDLSQRGDLTAAVISTKDKDGIIHVKPFCFLPMDGIEAKSRSERVPYAQWVRDGLMYAVPGSVVDYEWVCQLLMKELDGMRIKSVQFDRWRIDQLKSAAERVGFAPEEWVEVGQGYRSFSPILENVEQVLLQKKVRHGGHALLNMAAANSIAIQDPTGAKKLDKSKATQKIDPMIAMVMSVSAWVDEPDGIDVSAMIC